MDAREIVRILDERGEVSLDTWKAVSVKKNGDGTVDVLYRNLHVGTDGDPVFLWVYANILEDSSNVCVLERITFKREDIAWILRYVVKKGEGL